MQAWAEKFYKSKRWQATRRFIYNRDNGVCAICGEAGEIVHHKIPLTENNINNPELALGAENLILLCRDCHGKIHGNERLVIFTEDGQPVPPCYG